MTEVLVKILSTELSYVRLEIVDAAGRKVSFIELVQSVATTWGGSVNPYLYILEVGERIVATNNKNGIHQVVISNIENVQSVESWKLDKEVLVQLSPAVYIHSGVASEQLGDANECFLRIFQSCK